VQQRKNSQPVYFQYVKKYKRGNSQQSILNESRIQTWKRFRVVVDGIRVVFRTWSYICRSETYGTISHNVNENFFDRARTQSTHGRFKLRRETTHETFCSTMSIWDKTQACPQAHVYKQRK
jgi:hypothetical protein